MKNLDEFIVMEFQKDGSLKHNYYDSKWNDNGGLYLTYDGASHTFHLLIPEMMTSVLKEMQTGEYIVMTTGYGTGKSNRKFGTDIPSSEMVELLFEDNGNSPYMTYIGIDQCVWKFNDEFTKKGFKFVIHTKTQKHSMTCYVRSGGFRYELPCLKEIDVTKYEMV